MLPRSTTPTTHHPGGGSIRYWFMYGYNKPANWVSGFVDPHEGEWEGDAVKFDEAGNATDFAYYQHNCQGEPYSWEQMLDKGYTEETNVEGETVDSPVVYSAQGAHASYPKVPKGGEFGKPCPVIPRVGLTLGRDVNPKDRVSKGGPRWKPVPR